MESWLGFCHHLLNARTGILEGNPIHEDMLWAARRVRLKFIVNVVLNSEVFGEG